MVTGDEKELICLIKASDEKKSKHFEELEVEHANFCDYMKIFNGDVITIYRIVNLKLHFLNCGGQNRLLGRLLASWSFFYCERKLLY